LTNLVFPHGVALTSEYVRDYIIIGLGVLGTTITPWGQFFISSFAFDKKIESARLKYSQFETYWGAFLTDFFSFFMIVATAATLNVNKIPILSGEQAALAIKPFAGEVAAYVFALGILNAGFMGIVIVSLTTAYAFAEFFGLSGSLDTSFTKSRVFYTIFIVQLVVAGFVVFLPNVSLFQLAVAAQGFNAMMLPFVFYYLLKLTNNPEIMGVHINKPFQRRFATVSVFVISIASVLTLVLSFVK
jgi:Mn2+/Fe2+ NRAMP family transporter